jgi:hypothetical protein
MPRFHTPLVEPGMQIYRTRLSWKHHDFAHEKLRVRSVSRIEFAIPAWPTLII